MERILFIFFNLLVCQLVGVDAGVTYAARGCVPLGNYTQGSVYQENLNLLFSNLSSQASVVKFYKYTVGDNTNKVYGLFQCRQDWSQEICSACIQDATQGIVQMCPSSKEAIVWYQECMLRYANRSIFSEAETTPSDNIWSSTNVSNEDQFVPVLAKTMNSLIKDAAFGTASGYFATREANLTMFSEVYTLAQCTPDLDRLWCYNCLRRAESDMANCCNTSIYAVVFLPSCQLWYDTSPFYDVANQGLQAPSPSLPKKPDKKLKPHARPAIIAGIAVAASVGIMLFFSVIWLCLHRKKTSVPKKMLPQVSKASPGVEINEITTVSSLQFDLNIIRAATCDFSKDNKLGEGGFGEVYKDQAFDNILYLTMAEAKLSRRTKEVERKEKQVALAAQRIITLQQDIEWGKKILEWREKRIADFAGRLNRKIEDLIEVHKEVELQEKQNCIKSLSLQLKEKQLDECWEKIDTKERVVDARCKAVELKEREINERCKALQSKENHLNERSTAVELKEKEIDERWVALESKENRLEEHCTDHLIDTKKRVDELLGLLLGSEN